MDSPEEPDTSIDPYAELEIDEEATDDQVKKAYRRLALKHHPDKAAEGEKDAAKERFQRLAFAYAILSDPRRRSRYDTTGSTAEILLDADDDFDWLQFYRDQYERVTSERITEFATTYKGSEEERLDLLKAYRNGKGSMTKIYQNVMLSNPLDDDERFRRLLDEAISNGEIDALSAYTDETERSKQNRIKTAQRQAGEAEQHFKDLKSVKKDKGKRTSNKDGEADLFAMIQANKKKRGDDFLARLEEKYANDVPSGKKGKKRQKGLDEPPEEAFERTARRKPSKAN